MLSSSEGMTSVGNVQVKDDRSSTGCCIKFTDVIIGTLENWFAKLGAAISKRPVVVIIATVIVSLLCIIGVVEYYAENRAEKLWVSSDSESLEHSNWVSDRYPAQSRMVAVIAESDNILTPTAMKSLIEIDRMVKHIYNGTDIEWLKICIPVNKLGTLCRQNNLLALWDFNYTLIESLNQDQILSQVNKPNQTNQAGDPINVKLLLGKRTVVNNKITGAEAVRFTYFLRNQQEYIKSKGARVDEKGEKWEKEFVRIFKTEVAGVKVHTYSRTGQREDSGDTISGDLKFLFVGYILIILYLAIMLGSFSRINQKIWLAICGVTCIGLAIGIAYGLSSAFQLFVSPVHNVLPFLLLGIGVDDVFVIIQNWDNYGGPHNVDRSIPENMALVMRHAGVSILVTSFTDVCAFLIGATTVLPALRSFCIFAGIGVLAVFILTCTLFIAWLALDSRRQRGRRDACCCCIRLDESWKPLECSEKNYLQTFMKNVFAKSILSTPGRIVCLIVFVGLLAGGSYGLSQLKQDFDPDWFLPSDSLTVQYNKAVDKYFSEEGVQSHVYVGQVDYFQEQSKLDAIYSQLKTDKYVVPALVSSWYQEYKNWLKNNVNNSLLTTDLTPKTEEDFDMYLNQFLGQKIGQKFFADIKRKNRTGIILASRMRFNHIKVEGASEEIKAMDSVQEDLENIKFSNGFQPFAYAIKYVGWETNKVISQELIRNLVLAGVVVFFVTLFLIANIWVSLMVLSCVVFTLINIAGYMHFWGLTVDTVTTIQLILAIGLSVDYSAHIGHGFMASRNGSRVERAKAALEEIGPAVVHGGFSTFLAFAFLAGSESYVFSTFFKVFFLVVVFGLFHGLVYLPVLLSLVGPNPYAASTITEHSSEELKVVSEKPKETYTPIDENSYHIKMNQQHSQANGHPQKEHSESNGQPPLQKSLSSDNEAFESDKPTIYD